MILDRILQGGLETLPLFGENVEQDRPVKLLHALKISAERLDVVAVDRADVRESEFLEKHSAVDGRLDRVLHLLEPSLGLVADDRNRRQDLADATIPVIVGRIQAGAVEVIRQAADAWADRHLVVVQNNQEVLTKPAGVVECLEDDARGERAVADHGDRVPFGMPDQVVPRLQSQGGRGGAAGVAGHEEVKLALGGVGITH